MSGSITRRGVLTAGAALAGMTALPQLLNTGPRPDGLAAAGPARAGIGHVVVDERLTHSALFARGVGAQRLHVVNALDDLCHRWYTRLRAEVLADAGHIAGLTNWMDYVVMRGCAAEIGYVSAFHAEHRPLGPTGIEHSVADHAQLLAQITSPQTPHGWAESLGGALARGAHPPSRVRPGQTFRATVAAGAGTMHMVTWVFAPRY
jgi:hypothetical protein